MKRPFIFLAILCSAIRADAQKKDSLVIDFFSRFTGDKYGYLREFDHTPTKEDSAVFFEQARIWWKKIDDSVKRAEVLRLNHPKKKTKKKP